jgi:hypothetical protein
MMSENGDESPTQARSIKVDPETYERFEEQRKEAKTEHIPPMDQSSFLSSLLDTQQAVLEGRYNDE